MAEAENEYSAPTGADTDANFDVLTSGEDPDNPGQSGAEAAADRTEEENGDTPTAQDYGELDFPDGADEKTAQAFKTLARELDLPPEAAQKLVDLERSLAESSAEREENARQEILQRWADKTKEMFGPQYAREIDVALRAADAFGGPELRSLLEATGLGNHPVMVKTFNQIGRLMGEDECVSGRAAHGSDKTFTEALYGVKPN